MANSQDVPEDGDLVLSFFPDPPPFYKHFTTENIARLKDIEKESTIADNNTADTSNPYETRLSSEQIPALPTELRYLIPPAPPADDADFHVFDTVAKAKGTDVFMKNVEYLGYQLSMQDVLKDWTYEQLYPSPTTVDSSTTSSQPTSTSASIDRQNYLFRFLRSILMSYISLLGVMAVDSTSPQKDEKLRDIMTLVANMHALINEYRPHQARQTLIEKMEEQVRRKRDEIQRVKKMGDKIKEVLEGFGRETEALGTNSPAMVDTKAEWSANREDDRRRNAQRLMWDTIDELLEV